MDYDSLTTQIKDYSNRTDEFFIKQIPNFINQGISRIYSEARSIGFQKIIDRFMEKDNAKIDKPSDWEETISLSYVDPLTSNRTYLLPRSYEFCRTYSPTENQSSKPIFYADFDILAANEGTSSIFVSPQPDGDYSYQLIYLSQPLFTEQYPTNFLTDRYPSLLLYACLFEAIPFLKDDERIATFESLYNRALKDIMGDSKERYNDRLSTREKT